MIYVNKDQLKQVEYLISQASIGNHILFDVESIRHVYKERIADSLGEDDMYGVEQHIERLITLPTLAQKKAFLERLDIRTFRLVVKTYFNIVENSIFENQEIRH